MNENDKQAEPVGQVTSGMQQNGSQCFKPYSDDALPIGAEIYATAQPVQPAAVAVNEQFAVLIKKANDQAEHFEREWYLRGDELEALEQVNAQLLEALKELMYARTDKAEGMAEAAIAAAEAEKAKGGCLMPSPKPIHTAEELRAPQLEVENKLLLSMLKRTVFTLDGVIRSEYEGTNLYENYMSVCRDASALIKQLAKEHPNG